MIIGMRRKVKTFLHVLTGSIVPQSSYYAKVLKSRLFFSLLYFMVLLSLTATATVIITFFKINANNPVRIESCLRSSLGKIPSGYTIHISNGVLSTSREMPLFVWFNCDDKIRLLAVVDERAGKKDIQSYGAQILFTGSEVVARYKSYSASFPYGKYVKNLYLDRAGIIDYADKAIRIIRYYVPVFSSTLLLLIPLFIYTLNTLYIILSSLFVHLFFVVFKKRYKFRKVLQVGMHSASLPLITSLLFIIFPINVTNTLLLYFSLFFIFQLVAVYEAHYVQPHHAVHHSPLHKRP